MVYNTTRKIARWNEIFINQIIKYDFKSLRTDQLRISSDYFVPTYEGLNLPTDTSASDFIRIIWAYLTGLLEVSSEYETNHIDLLIFDEPKQQSTKEISGFGTTHKRHAQAQSR